MLRHNLIPKTKTKIQKTRERMEDNTTKVLVKIIKVEKEEELIEMVAAITMIKITTRSVAINQRMKIKNQKIINLRVIQVIPSQKLDNLEDRKFVN